MYRTFKPSINYALVMVFAPMMMSFLSYPSLNGLHMDVKCTVYQNGDVDVRVLVLGLKDNKDYTINIIPDHNPPFTLSSKTDFDGILWSVSKIVNGQISLDFKANVYEGHNLSNPPVIAGNDDAPCRELSVKASNEFEQKGLI